MCRTAAGPEKESRDARGGWLRTRLLRVAMNGLRKDGVGKKQRGMNEAMKARKVNGD